jgi:hypothetical protein
VAAALTPTRSRQSAGPTSATATTDTTTALPTWTAPRLSGWAVAAVAAWGAGGGRRTADGGGGGGGGLGGGSVGRGDKERVVVQGSTLLAWLQRPRGADVRGKEEDGKDGTSSGADASDDDAAVDEHVDGRVVAAVDSDDEADVAGGRAGGDGTRKRHADAAYGGGEVEPSRSRRR